MKIVKTSLRIPADLFENLRRVSYWSKDRQSEIIRCGIEAQVECIADELGFDEEIPEIPNGERLPSGPKPNVTGTVG